MFDVETGIYSAVYFIGFSFLYFVVSKIILQKNINIQMFAQKEQKI